MGKIRAVLALSGISGGLFVSACGSSHQPVCQTDRQVRGALNGNTHCTAGSSSTGSSGSIIILRGN